MFHIIISFSQLKLPKQETMGYDVQEFRENVEYFSPIISAKIITIVPVRLGERAILYIDFHGKVIYGIE